MLKRLVRATAAVALALALPVAAHHFATSDSVRATPGPDATAIALEGHVQEIVVTSRVDGTTTRFPILVASDGRRFTLNGSGAKGLVPGAFVAVAGMADGRTLFPDIVNFVAGRTAAPTAPGSNATLDGTLRLGHADNFDGTPSEFFFSVITDSGHQVRIALATLLTGLENGMRVSVTGAMLAGDEIAPTDIVILAPADATSLIGAVTQAGPVTTNYLVMPVKFPTGGAGTVASPWTYGADPFTSAALNTAVFGAAGSSKAYYNEVSYGQQLLSGVTADNGSGGFLLANVAKPATCDINAIATAAENAATARGYNVASYTGRLYVFNNVGGCGWSGLAYVGWARAYSNNTTNLLVISHELGHNYGLYHAASLDCGTNPVGGACTSAEYGDPFDVMGNQRAMHFNSAQKSRLNWIPAGTVATHTTGTSTYTLTPLETAGAARYAVKIPAAPNRTYWVEFRQPIGFDSGLSAYPNNGAQIRVASPFESLCGGCGDDTEFLDMTPATSAFTDGTLVAGQTYTDSVYGIGVSVTGVTATALTVQVTAPGTGTSTITQTTSITPANFAAPVKFTATVTASGLSGHVNFTESGAAIAGCTPVTVSGGPTIYTASCTTSSLAPGTHSIVAVYAGDATHKAVASTALSQVVNKAPSASTVTSSLNPAPPAASVTFTATVTGTAPTGTFNFKDGATTITGCGTVALTGSGNVRTATCSTSTLPAGTHSITAVFAGDAVNSGSTSPALSQAVGLSGSTTGIASSINPSMIGQNITFTATVSATAPTGAVDFKDGGTSISGCAAVALTGSGNIRTAACSTSSLAVGSHSVSAAYAGDANNSGSASLPLSQNVVLFVSASSLASSLNPAMQGQNVTFTASVTGSAPTGTIAFMDGALALAGCSAVPLAGAGNTRTATCSSNALTQATHAMTASYSGNASNAASVSPALAQVITSAGPANSPVLQGASARKMHGAAGTFDLALSLATTSPTIEPRTGPAHTVVFTFDKPIIGATVAVTEGAATAGAPTFSGNDVVVALTNVTNQQYVTVALTSVAASDGGIGGVGTVRIGLLAGDTNRDRVVTVADVALVNAALAQPLTAANFLRDIDGSGAITVGDKAITNGQLAKGLPAP